MDWWIVVMVLGQLAFVSFIIWIGVKSTQDRLRQRSEERFRLLERFGSGQELLDFLNSSSGERFFTTFSGQRQDSLKGAVMALGSGLVLLLGGAGCMLLAMMRVWNDRDTFLIPGVLGIAVGIAILIAAGVSLRMTRRLPPASDLTDVRRSLEP